MEWSPVSLPASNPRRNQSTDQKPVPHWQRTSGNLWATLTALLASSEAGAGAVASEAWRRTGCPVQEQHLLASVCLRPVWISSADRLAREPAQLTHQRLAVIRTAAASSAGNQSAPRRVTAATANDWDAQSRIRGYSADSGMKIPPPQPWLVRVRWFWLRCLTSLQPRTGNLHAPET